MGRGLRFEEQPGYSAYEQMRSTKEILEVGSGNPRNIIQNERRMAKRTWSTRGNEHDEITMKNTLETHPKTKGKTLHSLRARLRPASLEDR